MKLKKRRIEKNRLVNYERMFLKNAEITARIGKAVYLRREHHEKIRKIIQVIGCNELTIFSYVDNVLHNHFGTYKDEIQELYDKHNKAIF